jgi:very-short-patch-repair endonuclease
VVDYNHYRVPYELWLKLQPLAKEMRREPTPAEAQLWYRIRGWRMAGAKFRRQVVIERFIVDFYAPREWLIVEVDGEYHQYTGEQDAIRQEYLESRGLKVLRVSNQEVMENMEGVLILIRRTVIEGRKMREKR